MILLEDEVNKFLLEVLEGKWRSPAELEGLEKGQAPPIVAVLCGDSRCQANDVHPQPRNNIFLLRTIGSQALGVMGSLAYPTQHLQSVMLALVVGHVSCGAVAHAAEMAERMRPVAGGGSVQEVVNNTLDYHGSRGTSRKVLATAAEEAIDEELSPMAQFFANAKQFLRGDEMPYLVKHAVANVHLQIAALLRLRHVQEKVKNGGLVVAGLLYDFTGRLGKKGSMRLVSYNGNSDVTELEKAPIAAASGNTGLILPQQNLFMTQ